MKLPDVEIVDCAEEGIFSMKLGGVTINPVSYSVTREDASMPPLMSVSFHANLIPKRPPVFSPPKGPTTH